MMRQISFEDLKNLIDNSKDDLCNEANNVGKPVRIYLHWSAGHYSQAFSDYHINIDYDGSMYTDAPSLATVLEHTWHENTGAIGLGTMCCAFATTQDFGQEPPTAIQIETLCKVVAILAQEIDIPIDYQHVQTHAESANENFYGPNTVWERWDYWYWPGVNPGEGGNILRGKANYYLANGINS